MVLFFLSSSMRSNNPFPIQVKEGVQQLKLDTSATENKHIIAGLTDELVRSGQAEGIPRKV